MNTDDQNWSANGNGRSPGRNGGEPPRRSSRSRSPGPPAKREGEHTFCVWVLSWLFMPSASSLVEMIFSDRHSTNPGNNLHISGLSHRVDSRDLEAAFAKIGRVKKASVMYDPHTRESRGFGFVTMETPEEADAALTALNSTELMGKIMNVEKARRGRARTPTPGRYYGPPKRHDCKDPSHPDDPANLLTPARPADERPYDPRPYDSRYSRDFDDRRDRRRDDYRRDYDRHRYDDRDRDRDRGYGRDRYDDRRH
ncbi:hypothetical protein CPB84DRAFT_1846384 [Gymnopilus junonius]|uniref:RRM domain-containing protein n=1 Tax=Gymnopilus junonius TaxID=109634 RepID=A0A9P5NPR1_GYMJU|nr:hypothetical protein CPB84DRAFT_1846384 [Gymnopilus junonius]